MRKKFLAFLMVCLLVAPIVPPTYVYAVPTEESTATNEDLAYLAAYLLGEVFELILDQYVGGEVAIDELYDAALYGVSEVLDLYSEYLNSEEYLLMVDSLSGRLTGIGVVMRMNDKDQPEIIRVLPDTPAEEAGVMKGDIITAVNNIKMGNRTLDEIISLIANDETEKVKLEVKRGKKAMSFNMLKREIHSPTVHSDHLENMLGQSVAKQAENIRYIRVSNIGSQTADDFKEALEHVKDGNVTGLILDFRGNPGGYLSSAIEISNLLIPEGPIFHTIDSYGHGETYSSTLKEAPFSKIAVLVDSDTASAAELITAALQDAKAAVVIGENTYGKGVIQSIYPLTTGGAFKLTTEEYLRRSGEPINNIGVIPDFKVKTNVLDYETEKDTGLLKALEWMTK